MTPRLWPYLLAAVPWLLLLFRVRRRSAPASRVPFPALELLRATTRKTRRRRAWREILHATLRCAALLSLAFLWNHADVAPQRAPDDAPPTRDSEPEEVATILVVEGFDTARTQGKPTNADYLELALSAQFDGAASIRRVAPLDFATRGGELLDDCDVLCFADFSSQIGRAHV